LLNSQYVRLYKLIQYFIYINKMKLRISKNNEQ